MTHEENHPQDYFSDEEEVYESHLLPINVETWHDYFSGDLSGFWLACKDFLNSSGLPILDCCTYADFVDFCHKYSSGKVVLDDLPI